MVNEERQYIVSFCDSTERDEACLEVGVQSYDHIHVVQTFWGDEAKNIRQILIGEIPRPETPVERLKEKSEFLEDLKTVAKEWEDMKNRAEKAERELIMLKSHLKQALL